MKCLPALRAFPDFSSLLLSYQVSQPQYARGVYISAISCVVAEDGPEARANLRREQSTRHQLFPPEIHQSPGTGPDLHTRGQPCLQRDILSMSPAKSAMARHMW